MKKNWRYLVAGILTVSCHFMLGSPVMAAGLRLSSPAFNPNDKIPVKYTCTGDNVNPPLDIRGIPAEAKTLTLIVDDPDAPMGTWIHWVVYNIPPVNFITEKSVPGKQALNSFGKFNYGGPCPPSGTHRYFFRLYALDTELKPSPKWTQADVLKAMEGHVLAETELVGVFRQM